MSDAQRAEQPGAETTGDGMADLELKEQLQQVERKPPLYRAFRWSLYGIYVAVAAWLVISIAIAAWQSVYGDRGEALRAADEARRPLNAAPEP